MRQEKEEAGERDEGGTPLLQGEMGQERPRGKKPGGDRQTPRWG